MKTKLLRAAMTLLLFVFGTTPALADDWIGNNAI
jgi:hypothetical protein